MKIPAGMHKKVWQVRPFSDKAQSLVSELNVSPILAQVLLNRQLHKADMARSFLSPRLTDLLVPEAMPGVPAAVERIAEAIEKGEKISIYGDYDVDGIAGVAILWHLLKMLEANVDYYIPHRVDEGYGLNTEAVHQLADGGTQLLITVDCGITAVDEVRLAKKLGRLVQGTQRDG